MHVQWLVRQVPARQAPLWHRALPTDGTRLRRLLLFAYAPAWLKGTSVGRQPPDGLTTKLLAQPEIDEETRELLGASGWM